MNTFIFYTRTTKYINTISQKKYLRFKHIHHILSKEKNEKIYESHKRRDIFLSYVLIQRNTLFEGVLC